MNTYFFFGTEGVSTTISIEQKNFGLAWTPKNLHMQGDGSGLSRDDGQSQLIYLYYDPKKTIIGL
jgi:hypothetical protein